MASVKDSFAKGIGYIKYDMQQLKEQRAELLEFIEYQEKITTLSARIRIAKARTEIENIDSDLSDLRAELAFYKDYFRYTKAEIEAIPMATEDSIKKDWLQTLKEKDDKSWTEQDSQAVFERARELDRQLGRIF